MASKYEKVFPKLKPLPVEDMDYQAKADVVKQSILESKGGDIDKRLTSDDLVEQQIELILEDVAENVRELCTLLVNAPRGRQHATVFARYWLQLRKCDDFLETQLKNVRLLLYAYQQLGIQQFTAEGVDSVKLENLGSVYVQPEVAVKVLDRDVFRDWCMQDGLYRELNMHHGTAQSLTRKRLINGDNEPPGVEAYFHQKLTK